MSARGASAGYALLAVLGITLAAATLAGGCVTAVCSSIAVGGADSDRDTARAVAADCLDLTATQLRWRPGSGDGSFVIQPWVGDPEATCEVTRQRLAAVAGDPAGWPSYRIDLDARSGDARLGERLVVELRHELAPPGLCVSGDAVVEAPLEVAGSGVYVGSSLRGRENVSFAAASGTSVAGSEPEAAADGVHGDLWPQAAVHAGAGIWAQGAEIHDTPGAWPADSDAHMGLATTAGLVALPTPAALADLREHAVPPGDALDGSTLHLERLPSVPPAASGQVLPEAGYVVVLPATNEPVTISGVRSPSACPLSLVVPGDALLGPGAAPTGFDGALVVCGSLVIDGPLRLNGHLAAGELFVRAAVRLAVPDGWRARPLAGLSRVVVTARERL